MLLLVADYQHQVFYCIKVVKRELFCCFHPHQTGISVQDVRCSAAPFVHRICGLWLPNTPALVWYRPVINLSMSSLITNENGPGSDH